MRGAPGKLRRGEYPVTTPCHRQKRVTWKGAPSKTVDPSRHDAAENAASKPNGSASRASTSAHGAMFPELGHGTRHSSKRPARMAAGRGSGARPSDVDGELVAAVRSAGPRGRDRRPRDLRAASWSSPKRARDPDPLANEIRFLGSDSNAGIDRFPRTPRLGEAPRPRHAEPLL